MILVSIIVPYYKKKSFIKKTIKSIKSQTYKNLEIIIIYDDENQSELKILKEIKKNDKRVKLIINKKSMGAGLSRNIGISKAKGKYLAFLDADDLWKKNKIETQLQFMIDNKLKISHTSYEILKRNKTYNKVIKAKNFLDYKELLFSCDIGLSTVMIKKNLINDLCRFPNIKTKEDFVLWLLILKRKIKIGALDKNLTTWRDLPNSLSSSITQKLKDGFYVYNYYMKFNIFKSLLYLLILSLNSLKKK
jgi:teichuronic acid biosynthesis glycosyltransferase TuaG